MKKFILFVLTCLLGLPAFAGNQVEYDPEDGSVEIPEVIILGLEGEYLVKMEQKGGGLDFIVTEIIPDEKGIEDSDEHQATYDPATGLVIIPLAAVLSNIQFARLEKFSVKMQQQEGSNFTVIEAIPLN